VPAEEGAVIDLLENCDSVGSGEHKRKHKHKHEAYNADGCTVLLLLLTALFALDHSIVPNTSTPGGGRFSGSSAVPTASVDKSVRSGWTRSCLIPAGASPVSSGGMLKNDLRGAAGTFVSGLSA